MSQSKPKTQASTSASKPRRSKCRWALRWIRRLVVLVSLCLLILAIGFVIYAWEINYRGDLAVRQVRGELAERGILNRYTQALAIDEGSNTIEDGTSAAYWRAAMHAQPDAGDRPIPVVGTVAIPNIEPRQQYHPDMVSAMRETIDDNKVFFDLISQAISAENGRFIEDGTEYRMNGLSMLAESRGLARWLLVRANLAEAERDGEQFTNAFLAIMDSNETLELDPGFMSKLVVLSIDALTREGITDGLSRIELNNDQLSRLINGLEKRREMYDLIPLLGVMISGEFHQTTTIINYKIAYWEAYQRTALMGISTTEKQDMEALFGHVPEKGILKQAWEDAILAWCPGVFQLENTKKLERAISQYDQILEAHGDKARLWKIVDQLYRKNDEDESISLFDVRGRMMDTISVPTVTRSIIRFDNSLITAITALQIERYRVTHNRWPDRLEDVVSDTRLDSYGQPLHYKTTAEGVILYSIGPNGVDEEGYGQYNWGDQDKYDDPDDFSVQLFDPELRNALPPPGEAVLPDADYDW